MKNKSKTETYSSELIENLINEINPEEQKKTDRKMMLAARIDDAMKAIGLKKGQLARALNKQPSEITKWLSGTHNFTTETLWDIGDILGIELINLAESKSEPVVYNISFEVSQRAEPVNLDKLMSGSFPALRNKQDFIVTSN